MSFPSREEHRATVESATMDSGMPSGSDPEEVLVWAQARIRRRRARALRGAVMRNEDIPGHIRYFDHLQGSEKDATKADSSTTSQHQMKKKTPRYSVIDTLLVGDDDHHNSSVFSTGERLAMGKTTSGDDLKETQIDDDDDAEGLWEPDTVVDSIYKEWRRRKKIREGKIPASVGSSLQVDKGGSATRSSEREEELVSESGEEVSRPPPPTKNHSYLESTQTCVFLSCSPLTTTLAAAQLRSQNWNVMTGTRVMDVAACFESRVKQAVQEENKLSLWSGASSTQQNEGTSKQGFKIGNYGMHAPTSATTGGNDDGDGAQKQQVQSSSSLCYNQSLVGNNSVPCIVIVDALTHETHEEILKDLRFIELRYRLALCVVLLPRPRPSEGRGVKLTGRNALSVAEGYHLGFDLVFDSLLDYSVVEILSRMFISEASRRKDVEGRSSQYVTSNYLRIRTLLSDVTDRFFESRPEQNVLSVSNGEDSRIDAVSSRGVRFSDHHDDERKVGGKREEEPATAFSSMANTSSGDGEEAGPDCIDSHPQYVIALARYERSLVRLKELKENVEENKKTVSKFEEKVRTLEKEKFSLIHEVEGLRAAIPAASAASTSASKDRAELLRRKAIDSEKIKSLESHLSKLKEENKLASSSLEEKATQVATAVSDVKKIKKENVELQRKIGSLQNAYDVLQKRIRDAKNTRLRDILPATTSSGNEGGGGGVVGPEDTVVVQRECQTDDTIVLRLPSEICSSINHVQEEEDNNDTTLQQKNDGFDLSLNSDILQRSSHQLPSLHEELQRLIVLIKWRWTGVHNTNDEEEDDDVYIPLPLRNWVETRQKSFREELESMFSRESEFFLNAVRRHTQQNQSSFASQANNRNKSLWGDALAASLGRGTNNRGVTPDTEIGSDSGDVRRANMASTQSMENQKHRLPSINETFSSLKQQQRIRMSPRSEEEDDSVALVNDIEKIDTEDDDGNFGESIKHSSQRRRSSRNSRGSKGGGGGVTFSSSVSRRQTLSTSLSSEKNKPKHVSYAPPPDQTDDQQNSKVKSFSDTASSSSGRRRQQLDSDNGKQRRRLQSSSESFTNVSQTAHPPHPPSTAPSSFFGAHSSSGRNNHDDSPENTNTQSPASRGLLLGSGAHKKKSFGVAASIGGSKGTDTKVASTSNLGKSVSLKRGAGSPTTTDLGSPAGMDRPSPPRVAAARRRMQQQIAIGAEANQQQQDNQNGGESTDIGYVGMTPSSSSPGGLAASSPTTFTTTGVPSKGDISHLQSSCKTIVEQLNSDFAGALQEIGKCCSAAEDKVRDRVAQTSKLIQDVLKFYPNPPLDMSVNKQLLEANEEEGGQNNGNSNDQRDVVVENGESRRTCSLQTALGCWERKARLLSDAMEDCFLQSVKNFQRDDFDPVGSEAQVSALKYSVLHHRHQKVKEQIEMLEHKLSEGGIEERNGLVHQLTTLVEFFVGKPGSDGRLSPLSEAGKLLEEGDLQSFAESLNTVFKLYERIIMAPPRQHDFDSLGSGYYDQLENTLNTLMLVLPCSSDEFKKLFSVPDIIGSSNGSKSPLQSLHAMEGLAMSEPHRILHDCAAALEEYNAEMNVLESTSFHLDSRKITNLRRKQQSQLRKANAVVDGVMGDSASDSEDREEGGAESSSSMSPSSDDDDDGDDENKGSLGEMITTGGEGTSSFDGGVVFRKKRKQPEGKAKPQQVYPLTRIVCTVLKDLQRKSKRVLVDEVPSVLDGVSARLFTIIADIEKFGMNTRLYDVSVDLRPVLGTLLSPTGYVELTPQNIVDLYKLHHRQVFRLLKQLKERTALYNINLSDVSQMEKQLLKDRYELRKVEKESNTPLQIATDTAFVARFADYFEGETMGQWKVGTARFKNKGVGMLSQTNVSSQTDYIVHATSKINRLPAAPTTVSHQRDSCIAEGGTTIEQQHVAGGNECTHDDGRMESDSTRVGPNSCSIPPPALVAVNDSSSLTGDEETKKKKKKKKKKKREEHGNQIESAAHASGRHSPSHASRPNHLHQMVFTTFGEKGDQVLRYDNLAGRPLPTPDVVLLQQQVDSRPSTRESGVVGATRTMDYHPRTQFDNICPRRIHYSKANGSTVGTFPQRPILKAPSH